MSGTVKFATLICQPLKLAFGGRRERLLDVTTQGENYNEEKTAGRTGNRVVNGWNSRHGNVRSIKEVRKEVRVRSTHLT